MPAQEKVKIKSKQDNYTEREREIEIERERSIENRVLSPNLAWNHFHSLDCVDHNKLLKILRDRNTRPPDLPPEKSVRRSRRNS